MATGTASSLKIQTDLFIGGQFVKASDGATTPTMNPHTNTKIVYVAAAGKADVDKAVKAAEAAFPKWSSMAAADRGRILLRLADLIESRAEELATLEAPSDSSGRGDSCRSRRRSWAWSSFARVAGRGSRPRPG